MHLFDHRHPAPPRRRRRAALPLAAGLALALGLAACDDDDDDTTTTTAATGAEGTTTTAAGSATGDTVDITGVDYAFEGVPQSVPAGTTLAFTNGSEGEVHELVALRIDDDQNRPLEELLGLPDEEAEEVTEFQGVSVALPGEQGTVVEGDLTLDEPGTYALLCFIPTGADPAVYEEILANPPPEGEGPPDVPGGPPHFTQGMVAELTVE
ncbi:MAG TPA: hypothetical protein VNT56_08610 [Acidimicrobiales bacterium]|nr:hypothetical protein [Acidimicrobiales bacterium]